MDFLNFKERDIYFFGSLVVVGLILLFFLMREVICWYYKINQMVKLQEEADKDRKDILRLLLDLNKKNQSDKK